MAEYDIDRDFESFNNELHLGADQENEDNLIRLQMISPDDDTPEDDTIFNERFVYCKSHHKVHSTGWCTVSAIRKRPLIGDDIDSAEKEAIRLGLLG